MKRLLILFLSLLAAIPVMRAQDADKKDIEERFTRVNTVMEQLMTSNTALQKRIDRLEEELRSARDDQSRSATNQVMAEDLRRLAEAIREVDHNRQADKELILDKLDKIARSVSGGTALHPAGPPVATTNAVSVKGYPYIVQSGDNLTDILAAYNKKFKEEGRKKVSLTEVKEANPGLKPNRLLKDQTIFIPQPPLQ